LVRVDNSPLWCQGQHDGRHCIEQLTRLGLIYETADLPLEKALWLTHMILTWEEDNIEINAGRPAHCDPTEVQ
jgi:hypothetical protein